ncbi:MULTISPECIES: reverse transcriptase domain-containing protein [Psychrobacter]|uniref:reverse transcriptase domain-containing protein n=1 Tax=Psychrobacter TaxID=497 RepID=UPI00191857DD|nr:MULTISPECIES: reverse transcriptase domain-containing protein [Psychrobacter]
MTAKVKFSSYVHKNFKTSLTQLAKNRSKADNSYHIDYITVNDYLDNFNENTLTTICHKISQLKYDCDDLTPIILPKITGLKYNTMTIDNTRLVCVPSVQDRILQRLFLKYLKNNYKKIYRKFCQYDHALNSSFHEKVIESIDDKPKSTTIKISGIRKALDDAIEYRNKYKYVVKADIVKFFDNINRELAIAKFKKEFIGLSEDKELIAIFKSFVYCEANVKYGDLNHRGLIKKYLNQIKGKGIRQGMPISSLCSSMYLHEFDNLMVKNDVPYIRYADDFLIFDNSYSRIANLKDEVRKLLKAMELDIEKSEGVQKTKIYGSNQSFTYLGFDVIYYHSKESYTLQIPKIVFDIAKERIHSFNTMSRVKRKLKKKASYAKLDTYFDRLISGYTNYYSEDLAYNGQAFKKHLLEESKEVRKKLITDNLNIDFEDIGSANKRMFFFGVK